MRRWNHAGSPARASTRVGIAAPSPAAARAAAMNSFTGPAPLGFQRPDERGQQARGVGASGMRTAARMRRRGVREARSRARRASIRLRTRMSRSQARSAAVGLDGVRDPGALLEEQPRGDAARTGRRRGPGRERGAARTLAPGCRRRRRVDAAPDRLREERDRGHAASSAAAAANSHQAALPTCHRGRAPREVRCQAHDLDDRERLAEEVTDVRLDRPADHVLGLSVGDEDERDRLEPGARAQALADDETVQARRHRLADDEARRRGLERSHGGLAVLEGVHLETGGVERRAQELDRHGVRLDDEHRGPGIRAGRRRVRASQTPPTARRAAVSSRRRAVRSISRAMSAAVPSAVKNS